MKNGNRCLGPRGFACRFGAVGAPLAAAALMTGLMVSLQGCGGVSQGAASPSPSGSVITSEADAILHMDRVRAAGFTGADVRVGVISTGVRFLASYQNGGLLPASLYVSQSMAGSLDEGSWMLELVHQHAPEAILGFCDGLDLDFHSCITDLAQNFHADIIVDDLLFSGQFYPDATATLIGEFEAANGRLLFVHLAGNEQEGGYWQGAFESTQLQIGATPFTVLDFGLASGGSPDPYNTVAVPPGAHLILLLNWNDPPHGIGNRALTARLLDATHAELTHASGQAEPSLRLDYTNMTAVAQTVSLVISLDSGSASGLAVQVTQGSPTCNIECQPFRYATSGAAGGTVGDFADAVVVGATNAQSPHTLEAWSNRGPFRIDFSATSDMAAPDGFDYVRLASPVHIQKPDLVAPDCVTVPFSDGNAISNNQFCGTSAAVPAIAAVAALLESAGFDRGRVLKALRSTALPIAGPNWDSGYGFGLADAWAALQSGGL